MSWRHRSGGNTFNTKSIDSYAAAKEHYENIKPMRGVNHTKVDGTSTNLRPIGHRRYHWGRITEGPKDAGGDAAYYSAVVYNTDCVRWLKPVEGLPPAIEMRSGTWATPTTARFIHYVAPRSITATAAVGFVRVNGWAVPRGSDECLRLLEHTPGVWTATNGITEHIHGIDRTKAAGVRRTYRYFRSWCKGYLNLIDNRLTVDAVAATLQERPECIKVRNTYSAGSSSNIHTPLLIGGIDAAKDALKRLLTSTGESKFSDYMYAVAWVANSHAPMYRGGEAYFRRINAAMVDKVLLAIHADEVLIQVPLGVGEYRRDPYILWVRQSTV